MANTQAQLVDYLGRPFDREALRSQQTDDPQIAVMNRTWELHPAHGMTPATAALTLQRAETGWLLEQCDLFADMEEDDHIFTEMSKRRRALLTVPWSIEEPPNASKAEVDATAFLREITSELSMMKIILEMTDAIGKGFSAQEIEWHRPGKYWQPKAITPRPQRWFRLDYETRSDIRLRDGSGEGAVLRPFQWILHKHPSKSGYVSRQALFRVLVWPWLFRRYGARDLAEFLEVYGLPVKIGTYPSGASDQQKAALYRALMSIGHNAAGILPEGMKIELMDSARGAGGQDPFLGLVAWAEQSISKAILGGTLNSSAQGGTKTNALGKVHEQAATDLRDGDAMLIAETLREQLFLPLLAVNGFAPERIPGMAFDLAPEEDVKAWVDSTVLMVDRGLPVPVSYALSKLQIPVAEGGEAILTPASQPAQASDGSDDPAATRVAALSRTTSYRPAAAAEAPSPTAYVDAAADTLSQEAGSAWKEILDQVKALAIAAAEEGKSLAEFRDELLGAFAGLDSSKLEAVMALGYACADLAGRYDVSNGN